ncbi:beta-ketoacyl-[acyl-carrier-protein] synthase family protein [Mucilaginibacter sp. X4EP1]|uniref:beta-ketoacyl-[acyl-carrier-protein] synthase family protein n=1 Tax=Mucilaginibacter sp. X4EP1 TaxID=2723092 RepID=UPI002169051B|nr:beta-ketoacyl-[acyl-carrier-protein] synthase family protein [Mucilaginibacter sp. X4EP1]MCS3815828.1 3-oxoacyl-(acyl-carrier-protein) synthase [Mucilaginibacter sp. X4EP1]
MSKRVVITGLGVVSPNGMNVPDFLHSIKNGISGIKYVPLFEELKFNCQVCGMPEFEWEQLRNYITETSLYGLKGKGIAFGIKAALDAWMDAGNSIVSDETLYETGCVFGSSVADTDVIKNAINRVDAKESKKLGSRVVEQIMNSGVTAYISGRLGLGNKIISNSSACATGTQAILMGYEYIKYGMAKRMVVGSSEYVDSYVFGAFDSMRVLSRKFNDQPEKASRPMSISAGGFVPGSGAGALILEDLDFALARGAKIYGEILGGSNNSGGQRSGGTMTAPAAAGVVRCITDAIAQANIKADDIDLISGHLTATIADKQEIQNWSDALGRRGEDFPMVNSLKSMIGHCLSAAGSIEMVAAVLQLEHQFVHPNINIEDPNPEIIDLITANNLPTNMVNKDINVLAKANFGFGDVNTCLIISKYK